MGFDWIHENPPRWDAHKARIVAGAPQGIFEPHEHRDGELIPGEWWRVEQDGVTIGYGWMDTTWGDAEILLAVDPRQRKRGAGTFILDRLEREAASRGLNYLVNVVRPTHPQREAVTRWLCERRFSSTDEELLRRRVRSGSGPT